MKLKLFQSDMNKTFIQDVGGFAIKVGLILAVAIAFMFLTAPYVKAQAATHASTVVAKSQSTKAIPVPAVIGKSADGKYAAYDVQGDLDDINWFSGNTAYNGDALFKVLPMIAEDDAKSKAYQCGFICKDVKGSVVGIDPAYKWMAKKK
jgi:hypothetical protein